jgi:hypothetical protein
MLESPVDYYTSGMGGPGQVPKISCQKVISTKNPSGPTPFPISDSPILQLDGLLEYGPCAELLCTFFLWGFLWGVCPMVD